jgi:hypothetical protein
MPHAAQAMWKGTGAQDGVRVLYWGVLCFAGRNRPVEKIMKRLSPVVCSVAVAMLLSLGPAGEIASAAANPEDGKLESVVRFDFLVVDGDLVGDGSGEHHDGVLQAGQIVDGKRKPAVQFAGNGLISLRDDGLDPAGRALSVGALCQASTGDGVVVSWGDATNGISLYIRDFVPHFAVRVDGELTEAAADEPICQDQWIHLLGTLDSQGKISLIVNGWPVAEKQGQLLADKPAEPFVCGADTGAAVGQYKSPLYWQGLLEDVRLYWGRIDRDRDSDELKD